MIQSLRTSLLRILALISIGTLLPIFGLAGQGPQDRVLKKTSSRNEPVKIVRVKAKGVHVKMGQKFIGEDDWWRGLTVSISNTSGKTIALVSINLDFPRDTEEEASTSSAPLLSPLVYGHDPAYQETSNQITPSTLLLPGDSVTITMSAAEYDNLNIILQRLNYRASIKQLEISIGQVIFNDGTSWNKGAMFRRDPNNPGSWRRAEDLEGQAANRNPQTTGASDFSEALFSHAKLLNNFPLSFNSTAQPSATTQLRCGKFIENRTETCSPQASCIAITHVVNFNLLDVLSPGYQIRDKEVR